MIIFLFCWYKKKENPPNNTVMSHANDSKLLNNWMTKLLVIGQHENDRITR